MSSATRMNKLRRDVASKLTALGASVETDMNTGHTAKTKISLNGKETVWRTSKTPSDVNAVKNAVRDLRKQLKAIGVEEPPQFAMHFMTLEVMQWSNFWSYLKMAEQVEAVGQHGSKTD